MSCCTIPSHLGSGYLPEPGGILLALQRCSLRRIGAGTGMAAFLVVPQNKSNRSIRLHVGTAENTRQLHDQRRTGPIVIRGLAEALPVHVGADDVHFVRVRAADLRAIHLFARSRRRRLRLRVERTKHGIRLRVEIGVDGRGPRHAAQSRAAHASSNFPAGN